MDSVGKFVMLAGGTIDRVVVLGKEGPRGGEAYLRKRLITGFLGRWLRREPGKGLINR